MAFSTIATSGEIGPSSTAIAVAMGSSTSLPGNSMTRAAPASATRVIFDGTGGSLTGVVEIKTVAALEIDPVPPSTARYEKFMTF